MPKIAESTTVDEYTQLRYMVAERISGDTDPSPAEFMAAERLILAGFIDIEAVKNAAW